MTGSTSPSRTPGLPADVAAKADRVRSALQGYAEVAVAYSGGVDSAVLLALAVDALGADRVVAVLGVSPSLAQAERQGAHEVAGAMGARLVEVQTHEGARAAYRANGPDRCYHCKDELFTVIERQVASWEGITAVAYGENADDAGRADRPGARAAREHAVLRPLADAGLGKAQVRALARALGLACADKPAAPCLASRVPHHDPVTPERLRQVELAEDAVRSLGFTDCRVRHHGQVARLELPLDELARAVTPPVRDWLQEAVSRAGFRFVTLDLGGIQSGAFTLSLVDVPHGR